MYLLKPGDGDTNVTSFSFTFHHVSIKTKMNVIELGAFAQFTFHHVSIKTLLYALRMVRTMHSHSTMYLLKPR